MSILLPMRIALSLAAVTLSCLPMSHAQSMPMANSETHTVSTVLPAPAPARDANIASLKLAPGFKITKWVDGLQMPRVIVVSAAGNLYISSRDAGTITMVTPTGAKSTVATLKDVHGLVIHDNVLFYVSIKDVYSAPILADGKLGNAKLLINDLPDAGQHPDRTLAIGNDGWLYESVGSTCNTCDEKNGINGTMQRSHLDGTGRETFATGLRNTIGMAFQPSTGALYGWDDGVDYLGSAEQREELNRIEQGKEYGWPYILGNGIRNQYLTPPKGVTLDQWAAKTTLPALTWAAHSSGMQLIFLSGTGLPATYNGDALASLHGSWNAAPPSGYEVVRVHFENGQAKTITPFVTGFLMQSKDSSSGYARFARPFGLVQLADGSIVLGDEQNGILYKITYSR